MIEITIPSMTAVAGGRIVGGHPMETQVIKDDQGKPKIGSDGQVRTQTYIGFAIPKQPGVDWKQTEWGQQIVAVANEAWPNGEPQSPTFAWKIVDGDSAIPNDNNTIPNQQQGYPGHWIINATTELPVGCYHNGRYSPMEAIQDKGEIKRGDYGRLRISVKGNNGPNTRKKGVYINPIMFSLDRAGEPILPTGTSASQAFGGEPMPAAAPTPVPAAAPAPSGVTPAPDFVNGPAPTAPAPASEPVEKKYLYQGKVYTRAQLSNWTDEQVAQYAQEMQ